MPAKARRPLLPKVLPPKPGRVPVRPGLARALHEAANAGVAWVQAPGGSGKTTAVALLAADLGLPVAWLHADAGDDQLLSFFHYLSLSIGGTRPRSAPALPVYGAELEAESELFARRFARAVAESAAGREAVLVIDNLQDIPAQSRVHGAIAALCEELAGTWKIFLVTREPPGAAYTRLLGQGRLVTIAPDRFSFTESELKEALRERGILDERRLDDLWKQSRGWIAGALLLAMNPESAAGEGDGPDSSDNASLFSYFANQAFSRLAPEDARLLLRTAFLTSVRPDAAAALSGLPDAGRRLGELAHRGLFVVRLGNDPTRFRYHDLFREFLCAQVRSHESPEAIDELKRATAAHLVAGAEPLPALELLTECGDWPGLRQVVSSEAERLLNQGHFRSLSDLLGKVPAQERDQDPWLLYWLAQCQVGLSDSEAVSLLVRANGIFEARADRVGQLVSAIGIPLLMRNQIQYPIEFPAWIAAVEKLADSAWEIRSPFLALKAITGLLSLVPLSTQLDPWTDRLVKRLTELVPQVEDPNTRLQALTQVVSLAWRMRRGNVVPPVVALVEEQRLEDRASPLLVLHWLYDLITFDSMYGLPERAIENAQRCERIAQATGLAIARYEALLLKLEVACDRNDIDAARVLLAELARHVDPARSFTIAAAHGFRARVALLEDAPEKALAEYRAAMAIIHSMGAPLHYFTAFFALEAGAHALAGQYGKALESCANWRADLIGSNKATVDVYEAWIRAAMALEQGTVDARRQLEDAVALAREQRFPLPLRHANRLTATLCAKAIEWSIDPDFVAGMIRNRGLVSPDPESPSWPWPLRVRCMGIFGIEGSSSAIGATGRNQKTVELLQAVIAMGGSAPMDRVISLLWPGEGRVGAQHALETTVYRLRKLLGSESCIAIADRRLALNRREMWVDALALNAILARLEGAVEPPDDPIVRTLAELHVGHFLPNRTQEPWAAEFRDRLWTRVRHLMVAAARRAREKGDPERAERLLFFVIDRHSVAEDAFAELMRLYIGLGQPGEALHAYRRCAAALASEMGLEPGAELKKLAAGIETRSGPSAHA